MSDNQSGAGAPLDGNEAGQGEAGASTVNATPSEQGGSGGTPPTPSANKLIKDFADSRGVTVSALLDQFQQMEDAGKTELQKLTGERDTWKGKHDSLAAKYRTVTARSAVTEAASKAGAFDPPAIFAIARDQLEYDDDGEPINLDAVLKDVQKNHPAQFRAANGSGDGGKGGVTGTTGNINDVFRELARTAQ